ncbi:PstS family phosphate ABC transporter substrate-binding protein [Pleurocapsa sp. PCC 7319]|uniref:PstS family phosphate ABC transporter substrate-binding protein n=1 Tax=Pleurocapsa sp. PCC 7319 TaxID=118161 RepID=UPI00034593D4|nr:substrate-binding domain-containing protein [Pleurocapsa sp. PCC 7319]
MKQYKICHNCEFSYNELRAKNCELCGKSLDQSKFKVKASRPKKKISNVSKNNKIKINLIAAAILMMGLGAVLYSFTRSVAQTSETKELPTGLLPYWGPPCSVRLMSHKIATEIKHDHPDFRLRLTDNDENKDPIEELLDDQLFLVLSEKPFLDQHNEMAQKKGFKLTGTPYAIDGIAYITNKKTNVESLNIKQLKAIYEGKISNWQQVGGENKTITPILLSGLGRNTLFLSLQELSKNTMYVQDRQEAMSILKKESGALFYTSATLAAIEKDVNIISLKNQENQIVSPVIDGIPNQEAFSNGQYPQTRMMYAIQKEGINGPVQNMVNSFVAYLTSPDLGQPIIEKSGFVPLYH